MVKKINEAEFRQEAMKGLSVVDFSAVWCGPCKMVAPVLESISEELDGQMAFYNVDVDENMNLAMEYKITNIPAILVMKDGEALDLLVGFRPKQQMLEDLKKYL